MDKIAKIVLVVLLFGCLLDMAYGYYQLVRLVAMIGFGILTYQAKLQNKQVEVILYGVLALIFQPFFKIALGRDLWNTLDVIVGVGLLLSLVRNKKNE